MLMMIDWKAKLAHMEPTMRISTALEITWLFLNRSGGTTGGQKCLYPIEIQSSQMHFRGTSLRMLEQN
jgi:hypothetical protein